MNRNSKIGVPVPLTCQRHMPGRWNVHGTW